MHDSTPMHQPQPLPQTVSISGDMPFNMNQLEDMYAQNQSSGYGPMFGPQAQAQQQPQPQQQQHRQPTQHQPIQMQHSHSQHSGMYNPYPATPTGGPQSATYYHPSPSQEFIPDALLGELAINTGSMIDMNHAHSMPPTPQEGPFHRRASVDYGTNAQGLQMGGAQHYAPEQQHAQGHVQQQHQQQLHHQGQQHQGQQQQQEVQVNEWSQQQNGAFPGWNGYQYL
jgi:hypothetical protein